jgi:hypothetical protein
VTDNTLQLYVYDDQVQEMLLEGFSLVQQTLETVRAQEHSPRRTSPPLDKIYNNTLADAE